jgi:hypothetical protein
MKRLKVVDFIRSSEVFNGGMVGKWWEYQHDGDIDGIFGYTFGVVGIRHPPVSVLQEAGKFP